MSALLYMVNEIKAQIPYEILHAGLYLDEPEVLANLTTLDDKLLTKIIRRRVFMDMNIVGGMELIVPLNNIPPLYYEDFYTIYRIDKKLTYERDIVSALGLSSMPVNIGYGSSMPSTAGTAYPYSAGGNNNEFNPINSVAARIGDSHSLAGAIHNAHLELVGPNTVLVNQHYRVLAHMGIRCIVENENNLNNIQPRSWKNLSYLGVLATKAYLYNKLIVAVNSGYLSGGQELGIFKSLIENMDGAEEEYRTYLKEVWGSVAYMNDTGRYSRLLSSMLAPDL